MNRRITGVAALSMVLLALPAPAATPGGKLTERTKQKQAAETQRSDASQKLTKLRGEIERTEAAKGTAADALAASESAISTANRSLRELAQEQAETEARLVRLANERATLAATVKRQQEQLARLLRDQHVAGNEDRIKLLLSGDNPNRINRELQFMGYVSQAQARLLESLRANLKAVEENHAATQNAKDELDEIAEEAKAQKLLLESEKAKRAGLLAQLSGRLASQRKEASSIERDEQRLAGLVEKLGKLIEEQQKAEAAERERQRQIAEAKRQKELEARKAAAEKQAKSSRSDKGSIQPKTKDLVEEAPATAKSLAKNDLKNELTPQPGVQDGVFAALRGKLRLPVRGDLTAKFGSRRAEGLSWKGVFIQAPEGSEIRAVAEGKVLFADYFRGSGNLIVVSHGGGYLTLYGNNQSVLKHAGDSVKTGDLIATAGNSGGNENSGLYFEIRHGTEPVDPLKWVTLK